MLERPKTTICCPYFKPVVSKTDYPIQGYCERCSERELRVPVVAELKLFCNTSDYHHCTMYRHGIETASFH